MATIVVTVEVAFDGSTFVDISDKVTRCRINYGRKKPDEWDFPAGRASIIYDNRDNSLTPGHSDSTYGNTQLIGREVRISSAVTGGADSHSTYLFRGYLTDVDYKAGFGTSTVNISVVDGFDKIAQTSIENRTFAEDYTGLRIKDILDLSSVNYPTGTNPLDRDLDLGVAKAVAASGVTTNTLDYMQKLARTENGRLLVNQAGTPSSTNKGGVLTFLSQNAAATDSGVTISDAVTLPSGSVEAKTIDLQWGSENLVNSYEFTDGAGTRHTGSSATSISTYGARVIKRTLLSDATATQEAGQYWIYLHDSPALRMSRVQVDVHSAATADAEKILHLNVLSSLDLSYLPPGSSASITGAYIVEGVNLDITVKDMATNAAKIVGTYATSAFRAGYFTLDDAVLGSFPVVLAPSWVDTSSFRLGDSPRDILPVSLG
jgi:hypothetical protein